MININIFTFLLWNSNDSIQTCNGVVGQVVCSLPAGFAAVPLLKNTLFKASPVAWAGNQHAIITCTPVLPLA